MNKTSLEKPIADTIRYIEVLQFRRDGLAQGCVISRNPDGSVASRYGDGTWDFSAWARRKIILNFGDGVQIRGNPSISKENANLLRKIVLWWLTGPRALSKASSILAYFVAIRPIFILCSNHNVVASNIMNFPALLDEIVKVTAPSKFSDMLMLLHGLFEHSDELGFVILNANGMRRIASAMPLHEKRQTPYIPPRIWAYQVVRLHTFLEDFLKHQQQIEDCFQYCLADYASEMGASENSFGSRSTAPPFSRHRKSNQPGKFESFFACAEFFGISDLIERWCEPSKAVLESYSIASFSRFFSTASSVAVGYILNFSLMRIHEVWNLRPDCLNVEDDDRFGSIYTICGETTKTVQDSDARWVCTPSVKIAIEVASIVSRLRYKCAIENSDVSLTTKAIDHQRLFPRAYEPWANKANSDVSMELPHTYPSFKDLVNENHKLFEVEELRIRKSDIDVANLVNPDLDRKIFCVGKIWSFRWHQLRRTGAVNMQSSGLVSDSSIQYQLKHSRRAMSLYYTQGYSKIRLNRGAAASYIRTMYEVIGRELSLLLTERFISPYGPDRKKQIFEIISEKDFVNLSDAAKKGQVSWRETLLGGCTKRGTCQYGGIDNIIRCGGGDGKGPCADALFDIEKLPDILKLKDLLNERLLEALPGSTYMTSLKMQLSSVERVIHEIRR